MAFLAAAVEPRIDRVAVEERCSASCPCSSPEGRAINAASILPGLLRDFGDVPDVLAEVAPRKVLAAAPRGALGRHLPSVRVVERPFTADPAPLLDWLAS